MLFQSHIGHHLSFLGSVEHLICGFGTHTELHLFPLAAALQLTELQTCLIATIGLQAPCGQGWCQRYLCAAAVPCTQQELSKDSSPALSVLSGPHYLGNVSSASVHPSDIPDSWSRFCFRVLKVDFCCQCVPNPSPVTSHWVSIHPSLLGPARVNAFCPWSLQIAHLSSQGVSVWMTSRVGLGLSHLTLFF